MWVSKVTIWIYWLFKNKYYYNSDSDTNNIKMCNIFYALIFCPNWINFTPKTYYSWVLLQRWNLNTKLKHTNMHWKLSRKPKVSPICCLYCISKQVQLKYSAQNHSPAHSKCAAIRHIRTSRRPPGTPTTGSLSLLDVPPTIRRTQKYTHTHRHARTQHQHPSMSATGDWPLCYGTFSPRSVESVVQTRRRRKHLQHCPTYSCRSAPRRRICSPRLPASSSI